jgi:hypothetical protein
LLGEPEFARSAATAAAAIKATLAWVKQQSWADAKRIVLAGASMGGLASICQRIDEPGRRGRLRQLFRGDRRERRASARAQLRFRDDGRGLMST